MLNRVRKLSSCLSYWESLLGGRYPPPGRTLPPRLAVKNVFHWHPLLLFKIFEMEQLRPGINEIWEQVTRATVHPPPPQHTQSRRCGDTLADNDNICFGIFLLWQVKDVSKSNIAVDSVLRERKINVFDKMKCSRQTVFTCRKSAITVTFPLTDNMFKNMRA